MNKILRTTLIVLAILILAGGLVFAGVMIGSRYIAGYFFPRYGMMNNSIQPGNGSYPFTSMMGRGGRVGPGLMGGNGMMGPGVQGYAGSAQPLTVDQAYQAAGKYIATLNNSDLKIAEVMVFDNNAYVRVIEQSSGIGAFELLVDPSTLAVYPEHGPNMMWNLKYGGLNHQNMMGDRGGWMNGMMGNFSTTPAQVSGMMTLSSDQALQAAQKYLDTALPGTKTASDADAFYGYYTIDILRGGKTVGMLSVNGYSGQVFLHTWHGTFIAASQDY